MGATKILIVICIVLVLILYIQSYLKPKNDYTIMQSYLDKLAPDSLYDKYPIVIYDIVKNPYDLLASLFAYSYLFQERISVPENKLYCNKSKFSLVYTEDTNGCLLNIVAPKFKVDINKNIIDQNSSVQFVTIKLKPKQIIILPMFWYFSGNVKTHAILLDDILSKTYRTLQI